MGITFLIKEIKFHHRVVALDVAFDVDDLVILQVLFKFFLKDEQGVCEVHFQWTWVVGSSLHRFLLRSYQRIKAEAQVNPLPKAAKQITSFSLTLPSAQASLKAIGMDAAVVLPYLMMLL
jgi:hypothetical protein